MNDKNKEDRLVDNIQTQLDSSLNNIDAATQSKITQARHQALDQLSSKKPFQIWLPAGAVATACLVVLLLSQPANRSDEDTVPLDELELLSNMEDIEVLEELEFYEWLDEYELPT